MTSHRRTPATINIIKIFNNNIIAEYKFISKVSPPDFKSVTQLLQRFTSFSF